MMNTTEIADKCGLLDMLPTKLVGRMVNEALETFAAEIRREQDKEIEQLKSDVALAKAHERAERETTLTLTKEIEQLTTELKVSYNDYRELQAKIAMISELLNNVTAKGDYLNEAWFGMRHKALTATEQEVSAWRSELEAKAIEECARRVAFYSNANAAMTLEQIAREKRSEGKC